ncbi:MAG: methyltransferase domain-containing protein [Acidimicrobiia bacterium]
MTESTPVGHCPACDSPVDQWKPGPGGRPRAACPTCGSLERHRFLAATLEGLRPLLATSDRVLEAAPQLQIRKVIRRVAPRIRYVGTDLMDLRWVNVCADALALPFRGGIFDLALHFHVFEHIPDDRTAMREVARVLRPGGLLICQVPQRPGTVTDEEFGLSPEENLARFGQADHVRYYGDDFEDRLVESGFRVAPYTAGGVLSDAQLDRINVKARERLWFATTEGGTYADWLRATRERSAVQAKYDSLTNRKFVRAGLAASRAVKPIKDSISKATERPTNPE